MPMTPTDRLVEQLNRTFRGPAWHGPTLVELLADVTAEEAAQVALPTVHTIWEIVLHAAAWKRAVRARVEGKPVQLEGDADWPLVLGDSERAWHDALADLDAAHVALEARVRALSDAALDEASPSDPSTSLYGTLHGVIQHDLYHAGQVAVLKKVLRAR
jgi:uncharacterized damage-inducible protein DinB